MLSCNEKSITHVEILKPGIHLTGRLSSCVLSLLMVVAFAAKVGIAIGKQNPTFFRFAVPTNTA